MSSDFERGFKEELEKIAFTWYNPADWWRAAGDVGAGTGRVLSSMASDPYKAVGTVGGGLLGYHLGKQYTGSTLGGLAGAGMGAYGGYQLGGALGQRMGAPSQAAPTFPTESDLSADWAHKLPEITPGTSTILTEPPSVAKPPKMKAGLGKYDMTITPRDIAQHERGLAMAKRAPSSYMASAPGTSFM